MMRSCQNAGFTLVEVMVALALLATVTTAMWSTMATSFETKDRVLEINDRYHEGRQMMTRISREIRMAFLRAEVPEEFREEEPAVVTRFKGEDDELYFASTAHLRIKGNTRESDQCEIAYFLKRGDRDDGYRGKTLYRRESTRLDDDPEKGGYIYPVLNGVKTFELAYWDNAAVKISAVVPIAAPVSRASCDTVSCHAWRPRSPFFIFTMVGRSARCACASALRSPSCALPAKRPGCISAAARTDLEPLR